MREIRRLHRTSLDGHQPQVRRYGEDEHKARALTEIRRIYDELDTLANFYSPTESTLEGDEILSDNGLTAISTSPYYSDAIVASVNARPLTEEVVKMVCEHYSYTHSLKMKPHRVNSRQIIKKDHEVESALRGEGTQKMTWDLR